MSEFISELFGRMYYWLEDFFGDNLANYLRGFESNKQETNMFIGIGLSMIIITLAVTICYYYVINHPRLNNWKGWLFFLGINAVINFFVGWQWVLNHYYAGYMVKKDKVTGEDVDLPINYGDILAFGVTNMIDAIIAFIVFSYIIKWWSTNCSRAPF